MSGDLPQALALGAQYLHRLDLLRVEQALALGPTLVGQQAGESVSREVRAPTEQRRRRDLKRPGDLGRLGRLGHHELDRREPPSCRVARLPRKGGVAPDEDDTAGLVFEQGCCGAHLPSAPRVQRQRWLAWLGTTSFNHVIYSVTLGPERRTIKERIPRSTQESQPNVSALCPVSWIHNSLGRTV